MRPKLILTIGANTCVQALQFEDGLTTVTHFDHVSGKATVHELRNANKVREVAEHMLKGGDPNEVDVAQGVDPFANL